jgi:Domain of unknown function (DUF6883)
MLGAGRTPHNKALPNFERAVIPPDKLQRYLLDPSHPVGKNKAVVFKKALGYEQAKWEMLRDTIFEELPYYEAVRGRADQYGIRYNVTLAITGPNGRTADVLTVWIIEDGKDHPSFVTAVVR